MHFILHNTALFQVSKNSQLTQNSHFSVVLYVARLMSIDVISGPVLHHIDVYVNIVLLPQYQA